MAKQKTIYICEACGATASTWIGRCPQCGAWNTLVESVVDRTSKSGVNSLAEHSNEVVQLNSVKAENYLRIQTNINELDRVLGGGLMPGSVVLIGGEPGIGKSTLLLQLSIINGSRKTLYVAGEESPAQIKDRANRLNVDIPDKCLISTELIVENLCEQIKKESPDLVIIDSIQTIHSRTLESIPGTISQLRESAYQLINIGKLLNIPIFLVGHITKTGNIAGPKVLEHMVDTVLQFEGEHSGQLRILRTTKNRFGSTAEIGVFEMRIGGLVEISNPSELLTNQSNVTLPGTSIALINEGIRPMMVEVQALVSRATFGTPQRTANGYDHKRLNMLLAILEKRAGLQLSNRDVFVNVAGGLKVVDTAVDLAMAASIISSYFDVSISNQTCFAGELGLTGEIRKVNQIENRIKEATRLGYVDIYARDTKIACTLIADIRDLVKIIAKK